MKIRLFILGILIVITGVVITGCGSTSQAIGYSYQNNGRFADASIPVKDFQSVGLVFTEIELKSEKVRGRPSITGNIFTYQELLKKANELGADAIINVTIDKKTVGHSATTTSGYGSSLGTDSENTETWYGSALAIKYTNAIIPQPAR